MPAAIEKIWVKFLMDHGDNKKDAIVEIEDEDGIVQKMLDLKIVEKSEAPDDLDDLDDDTLESKLKSYEEKLISVTEKVVKSTYEKAAKSIEERENKIFAVAKDIDLEKMGGFKSDEEYWIAVVDACNPKTKAVDDRIIKLQEKAITGAGTDIDSEGGYLVPENMSTRMFQMMLSTPDNFLGRTDRNTTRSNNLSMNGMEATSERMEGNDENIGKFAGIRSYWLDEGDSYTASQPRFNRIRLELRKLGVLAYVTEEQLMFGMQGLRLTEKASGAINYSVDEALLLGNGATRPLGIFNSPSLIVIDKEAGQADDTIIHQNINTMYYRMPSRLRTGAIWICHPDVEPQFNLMSFRNASDSNHPIPIYMPPGGLSNSPFGTLMGRPVIPSQHCHSLGNIGDIYFVNWSQYLTLTRAGNAIRQQESIHVRFLFDERVFKFTFFVDGQPGWHKAVQDKNGPTTRSPFITLNARQEISSSGL